MKRPSFQAAEFAIKNTIATISRRVVVQQGILILISPIICLSGILRRVECSAFSSSFAGSVREFTQIGFIA
jgi:hypothetical protein